MFILIFAWTSRGFDSELVDLNYKVASLIFCHFWRSILRVNSLLITYAGV